MCVEFTAVFYIYTGREKELKPCLKFVTIVLFFF